MIYFLALTDIVKAQSFIDIVEKYIAMNGGYEKLKSINTIFSSEVGKIVVPHLEPRKDVARNYNRKRMVYRHEIKGEGDSLLIICSDGNNEVIIKNGKLVKLPDRKVLNDKYDTMLVSGKPVDYPFINYIVDAYIENKINEFEIAGEEVISGKKCIILKSKTYKPFQNIYLYIDKTDYMLVKIKNMNQLTSLTIETFIDAYTNVEGVLFPLTKRVYSYSENDSKKQKVFTQVTYDSIIINPKIDESIFDCSKLTKPVIKE
jgi:hypothetical protein